MRLLIFVALLPIFAVTASAQDQPTAPAVYRIHELTLVSKDLSRKPRQSIIHAFEGRSYNLDELSERIRFKFRDTGFAFVEVGEPQIIRLRACDADVSYAVHSGDQYRLSGITFTSYPGQPVFTAAQLRSQFHIEDGTVFNATEIGKGLENLKDLYGSAGHPNFGAIPKPSYDNSRHTISLAVDIDQGFPVTFGKLFVEGIEPRAGAAQQLLASWKELGGRLYNSQLLKDWLKENSASWPSNAAAQAHIEYFGGYPSAFDVMLHFQ